MWEADGKLFAMVICVDGQRSEDKVKKNVWLMVSGKATR